MLSGGIQLELMVCLLLRKCERGEERAERFLFFLKVTTNRKNESANRMLLTKEATDKDRSLKTQLLFSTVGNKDEKISGERIWKSDGFFGDLRPDLKLDKKNIPENCLLYFNQGFLSTVKMAS